MKKVAAFFITVCCLRSLVGCAYTPSDDKNDPEVTAMFSGISTLIKDLKNGDGMLLLSENVS